MTVVGVDGCSAGWVAVVRSEGSLDWGVYESLAAVVTDTDPERLLLDIPVGLPSEGRRACDDAAKEQLGSRASTVFYTPARTVLAAENATGREMRVENVSVHTTMEVTDGVVRVGDGTMRRRPDRFMTTPHDHAVG